MQHRALIPCLLRPLLALLLAVAPGCAADAEQPDARALRRDFPGQADKVLRGPAAFAAAGEGFEAAAPALLAGLKALHGLAAPQALWAPLPRQAPRSGLRARLPRRGDGAVHLALPDGFEVHVRERGASGEGALEGDAVMYSRDGGASFWAATDAGYEEWLLLAPSAVTRAAPVAVWDIHGAAPQQRGQAVELADPTGEPRLRVTAPLAYAAPDRPVAASLAARGTTIELWVDAEGEAVLVDPAWIPLSSHMTIAREQHSATVLHDGRVLVAGGSHEEAGRGWTALSSAEVFDPGTGRWTVVPPMAAPRKEHTATLLPEGRVLVIGGLDDDEALQSVEIFDPRTNGWTTAPPMASARHGHTATLLRSGDVLVVGGWRNHPGDGSPPRIAPRAEVFDPRTQAWTQTRSLNVARGYHTASLLPDGRVLVAGGEGLASVELFDPGSGTWTPAEPMYRARSGHIAELLPSGELLVAGGSYRDERHTSAEIFNPAFMTWTRAGSLGTGRSNSGSAVLADGRVVVAGGNDEHGTSAAVEIFDPDTWTWSATASLNAARQVFPLVALKDGRLLAAGGHGSWNALKDVELFEPSSGSWAPAERMDEARANHTATLLADGRVLVAGGLVPVSDEMFSAKRPVASALLFQPEDGRWIAAEPMRPARDGHAAVRLTDGRVLVSGGQTSDDLNIDAVSSAALFNPATLRWAPTASMRTARRLHTMTLLDDGRVLAVGGMVRSKEFLATSEIFDPRTERWTETGPLTSVRIAHTATLLRSGRVLVTGGVLPRGDDHYGMFDTAEVFDPETGAWREVTQRMRDARTLHTATLLDDGRVLIAGGDTFSGNATVEVFNPESQRWEAAPPMYARRSSQPAALLENGCVLIAGGVTPVHGTIASVELFDPRTFTWRAASPMAFRRSGHSATRLLDGRVLLVGGVDGDDYLPSAELFSAAPLGAPCSSACECQSGHCVDGVCCDKACEAVSCEACSVRRGASVEGICTPRHPECSPFACDAETGSCVERCESVNDCAEGYVCDLSGGCVRLPEDRSFFDTSSCALGGAAARAPSGAAGRWALPLGVLLLAALAARRRRRSARGAGRRLALVAAGSLAALGCAADAEQPDARALRRDFPGQAETVLRGRAAFAATGEGFEAAAPALLARLQALGGLAAPQSGLAAPQSGLAAPQSGLAAPQSGLAAPQALWAPLPRQAPRSGLRARLPRRGDGAVHLALPDGFEVHVRERGASGEGALEGDAVMYSRDGGASFWAATDAGYEEWLLLAPSAVTRAAPVAVWDIHGAAPQQRGQAVELVDPAGEPRLSVTAPLAYAAPDRPVAASLVARGTTIELWVDADGEAVLVDPAWIPLEEAMTTARALHTATRLDDGRVLVVGGQDLVKTLSSAELFDPGTGRWTAVSSMATPRRAHTATLLRDGRVLVAGGSGDAEPLSSVELFDPRTGAWTAGPRMQSARHLHTATLLASGAVLVVGGTSGEPGDERAHALGSAELLDPLAEAWTATPPLSQARLHHTASLLLDGRVLVAGGGGDDPASAEVFSPQRGEFRRVGRMNDARSSHTATLLRDGRLLVAGGDDEVGYLASAEIFDPAVDTWTRAAPMASARSNGRASRLADGRVLVAGGLGESGPLVSVELFDPESLTWVSAAPMRAARSDFSATLLQDGRLLAAGGYGSSDLLASADLFDPHADAWTPAAAMAEERSAHTATLLHDGRVLVAGGVGRDDPAALSSAELFDPAGGAWTRAGSMRAGHTRHAAALLSDGRVLVAGGVDPSSGFPTSAAELFDPATRQWSAAGAMRVAREGHQLTALKGGRALVTGGLEFPDGSAASTASAELFDPGTQRWAAAAPMRTARHAHTATLLRDGRVLVAGGESQEGTAGALLSSAEVFDPSTNAWTQTTPMKAGRRLHTATLLDSGQVLIAGGIADAESRGSELFDPGSQRWQSADPTHVERLGHAAALLSNGCVLVAGGALSGRVLSSVELFDPRSLTWNPSSSMNAPRNAHTATALPDGRVLLAGSVGDPDVQPGAELFSARPIGAVCSSPCECRTGHCVDGVCCDQACEASGCEACSRRLGASADGICTPLHPECSPFTCDAATGSCKETCDSINDCAAGYVCDLARACAPLPPDRQFFDTTSCALARAPSGASGRGARPLGLLLLAALPALAAARRRAAAPASAPRQGLPTRQPLP
ncbi:kelch repeat-containing protein [Sorangium sp. So ce131]|uniref:kelch repeat-containing protein n=1 Tax=Sorangium sp. So ce131 TaxID=3133282 RepID=UPI003F5E8748